MNSDNVLILDTETTGLEPDEGHQVIEIAVILYNVTEKIILQQFSTLLPVVQNEAEQVNKIPVAASQIETCNGLSIIPMIAQYASLVVAHNADFDRKWMNSIGLAMIGKMKWICSCHEFKWPHNNGSQSLVNIALSLDIPVVSAHRALTDCILLANCFSKLENLGQLLIDAAERKMYVANVSFDQKDLAKKAGFIWNNLVPGKWAKKLTPAEANESFDFSVFAVDVK